MSILICGGAGYIGSHMVARLLEEKEDIIILDNFQKGHKNAILGGKVYKGDIRDKVLLDKIFNENSIEGVIDFAANSLVGESVEKPLEYFDNNIWGTITLLKSM
ncbi:UDP-glucose 4-epimerase, partial [Coprococcus sp. MSK.21.13]|nr:GDP-mannose 4,6-dehydratase [Bacteroidales bacterium MSK.15.36]NSJ90294.1 UDP-glucose 4-epimerase [Coprococcus sp. MSK.21.13]